MKQIAILLTCHNRIMKTMACLESLFNCSVPENWSLDIFLVDDGSTDGTGDMVREKFPNVHVIEGSGNLYWSGGMRVAWEHAKKAKRFDGYLLLNDDVVLSKTVLNDLLETDSYAREKFNKQGIYVSSTAEAVSGKISYGGKLVVKKPFTYSIKLIEPGLFPKVCSIANANILLVMANVVEEIGIFDSRYIHGIADYDYSLVAVKHNFPLLISPNIGGYCENDHGNNWLSTNSSLKQRMLYLYSPTGLAYKENLYFLKKHFPRQLPYYFSMYWLKTFFPKLWDTFK